MSATVMPKDSAEYAEVVCGVFAQVVRRYALAPETESKITPSLLQALEYVYLHGRSPIRKIAAGLSISLSAASQLVDRLVRRGLAVRRPAESDRRLASVELTDAGTELVSRTRVQRTRWMEGILASMSPERRQALVESLEEFIRTALSAESDIEAACARCGIDHLAFCVINQAHLAATGRHIEDF